MTDRLITFETAKLAKEKGFEIVNDNSNSYDSDGKLTKAKHQNYDDICYASTQTALQSWFREKHKINVEANWLPNIQKYRCLYKPMDIKPNSYSVLELFKVMDKYYSNIDHDTYEDALEEGLQKASKLI